jgi:hypothetical protein
MILVVLVVDQYFFFKKCIYLKMLAISKLVFVYVLHVGIHAFPQLSIISRLFVVVL